ncbi:MAG: hypothetical protein ACF8GE_04935 [Phycisphaerales bacterium JB043]
MIQRTDTSKTTDTRLDACVVLAGGIKPSALESQTGVPTLDLWINEHGTVLERWMRALTSVLRPDTECRIIHSENRIPTSHQELIRSGAIRLIPERGKYRGPAGVVRDSCEDLDDDAMLLIVEASQWAPDDLGAMLAEFVRVDASTLVGVNPDRSPSGLYLTRRRSLECVPRKGFMDIKEQWLPRVQERQGAVRVHRLPPPGTLPIRSREQALATLGAVSDGAFIARNGQRCAQSSIAPTARVDPGARVVRSLVMPGAVVRDGAVVIRSVICHGAHVGEGERVIDQVRRASPDDHGQQHRSIQSSTQAGRNVTP